MTGAVGSAPRRTLLSNAAWAVLGTGGFHVCQLGALVLLTRFSPPELVGQYFFALAVATPVLLLFGLELRAALVSDAAGHFTVGTYLALRSRCMLIAGFVLAGVALWRTIMDPQVTAALVLSGVFVARLAWSAAEAGWGTFQRRERLDLLAWAYLLRGLATLVPFAVLLPLAARLAGARGSEAAVATAAAFVLHGAGFILVYYLYDRRHVYDGRLWDLSVNRPGLRALALQTLPLGLVALLINLCDSFPRWLFESAAVPDGRRQLGYFGALSYITLAGNLVVIQAATAAANRLSAYYRADLRAFLRLGGALTGMALAIGTGVVLIATWFGGWILSTLYTSEYAQFESEFRLIALAHALALLTNVFGIATTQMRVFWVQVPIQLVTLAATTVAAVRLIPGTAPVHGAAVTALVRAAVQLILYVGCAVLAVVLRERILTSDGRQV